MYKIPAAIIMKDRPLKTTLPSKCAGDGVRDITAVNEANANIKAIILSACAITR